MKATELEKTEILESREALTFYLETLFTESPVVELEEVETETKLHELTEIDLIFFALNGHKLALAVKDLKGIIELDKKSLFKLPEMKPYTIGYFKNQGKNIPVNDIYWALNSNGALCTPSNPYDNPKINHAIILGDERMAIPCDEIFNISTVKKEQIKWRKSKPNQRWFKGIYTENMSVILNASEIKRLFLRGYKPHD